METPSERTEPPSDTLLVAIAGPKAFVRVVGRGSFKVGPALKKFGTAAVDKGCREFVIDMGPCLAMDSTFMGVLAGLGMRLKREFNGRVTLCRLSAKNQALLRTLGLDRIVAMSTAAEESAAAAPDKMARLDTPDVGRKATAETIIEAHENLIDLSPENLPKFRDVLAYLKEDLQSTDDSGEGVR